MARVCFMFFLLGFTFYAYDQGWDALGLISALLYLLLPWSESLYYKVFNFTEEDIKNREDEKLAKIYPEKELVDWLYYDGWLCCENEHWKYVSNQKLLGIGDAKEVRNAFKTFKLALNETIDDGKVADIQKIVDIFGYNLVDDQEFFKRVRRFLDINRQTTSFHQNIDRYVSANEWHYLISSDMEGVREKKWRHYQCTRTDPEKSWVFYSWLEYPDNINAMFDSLFIADVNDEINIDDWFD